MGRHESWKLGLNPIGGGETRRQLGLRPGRLMAAQETAM